MPGDYDKDCVESVLRDDPEKDEGEAIAICRAQQAAEDGDVFALEETEFEADELDLLAEEDLLSRAAVGEGLVWVTQDASMAITAPAPSQSVAIESKADVDAITLAFPPGGEVIDHEEGDWESFLDDLEENAGTPFQMWKGVQVHPDDNLGSHDHSTFVAGADVEDVQTVLDDHPAVHYRIEGGVGRKAAATPDDAGNSVEDGSTSPLVAFSGIDEDTQFAIGTKSAAGRASSGPPRLSYPKKSGSNELDIEALPEEYQAALEADDFIVYGKASIEQYDTDDVPTKISMEALENALDRFFGSDKAPGIISFGHQDIPVGIPLEEYTLEEDAVIAHPDGETYEYDAGETIQSEVREDADGDGRRELWLASNIANDTEMGKKLRLAALDGDINGYSVTIHRNDDEITQNGRRVTDVDLHAVTMGTDEQIKNKGSTFAVTEFKAALEGGLDYADDAVDQMAEAFLEALMSQETDDDTEQKSAADRLREKLSFNGDEAQTDDVDEKADDDMENEDEDEEDDEEVDEKAGEDLEEVAQMVASVTDLSVEDAAMLLEEANGDGNEQELKGEEADDGGDAGDEPSFEAKFEAKAEEMGYLTEDSLEEKLEGVATTDTLEEKLEEFTDGVVTEDALEEKMDGVKQDVASAVGEEVDDVMQKSWAGETPDPSADEESTAQRVGDLFGGDN